MKKITRKVLILIICFIIGASVGILLDKFVASVSTFVITSSMENTLLVGDRLIVFKPAYLFNNPKRFDIICFYQKEELAEEEDETYTKRIIGLPGETIKIVNGKIYINDSKKPINEPYIKEEWVVKNTAMVYKIPEDSYFVLGDNRNNSFDSRYWKDEYLNLYGGTKEDAYNMSFVEKKDIVGKVIAKFSGKYGIILL